MIKSDEEIKADWERLENNNIAIACEYLRRYERDIEDYIADIVASLCNVDVDKMLTDTSVAYLAQARWLYWYALRYMTNETYDKIAERTTRKSAYHFTPNGIGQSINKMSAMIASETIWTKRWIILKRIIKLRDAQNDIGKGETVTMRIIAPQHVNVEIKHE
jgi:hypothetical protein